MALSAVTIFAMVLVAGSFFDRKRRREMEARPRITRGDVQAVIDLVQELRLPVVRLIPNPEQVPGPLESRLGGAPWGQNNVDWPLDASGAPYRFLAQINFAEIPEFPGYPKRGLLQFFALTSGGETNWKDRPGEPHRLRWIDDPVGEEVLEIPSQHLGHNAFPFASELATTAGIALNFERDELPPLSYVEPVASILPDEFERLPMDNEVAKMLKRVDAMDIELLQKYGTHWIGGHPFFIQRDVREDETMSGLNRVLLHMGSDAHVTLGDNGVLNFLISAEDLAARNFERVVFTFDCY